MKATLSFPAPGPSVVHPPVDKNSKCLKKKKNYYFFPRCRVIYLLPETAEIINKKAPVIARLSSCARPLPPLASGPGTYDEINIFSRHRKSRKTHCARVHTDRREILSFTLSSSSAQTIIYKFLFSSSPRSFSTNGCAYPGRSSTARASKESVDLLFFFFFWFRVTNRFRVKMYGMTRICM